MGRPKLDRLLGAMGGTVANAFRLMDVAEEVLVEYGDPPGAFGLLAPSAVLHGKAEWLYRAHAQELVVRVLDGGDTRLATDAEVLAGMMGAGTLAPLDADSTALVYELWLRLAPPGTCGALAGWSPQARTEEGKQRALLAARRLLRQASRRITDKEAA